MDGRQKRETERNIRANDFLQENKADFTNITVAAAMIADLKTRIGKVQTEYEKQLTGDGDIKQNYSVAKDAYQNLLDEMRDIAGFARSIGRKNAGFGDMFPSPTGSGRRKLIADARVFAANAATHEQKFVDRGMEEDFIDTLGELADALETALDEAEATTGKRVGATDALGEEIDEANEIVESIDPIVRRVYRDNPTNLAAWTYASHIERHTPAPRKKKKPPTE